MKAYAQRNMMHQSLDIMFSSRDHYLKFGDPEVVAQEVGYLIDEPSLRLTADLGQPLFDALWEAGFRPSTVRDSDKAIDALKNHIAFAEGVATKLLNPKIILQGDLHGTAD